MKWRYFVVISNAIKYARPGVNPEISIRLEKVGNKKNLIWTK